MEYAEWICFSFCLHLEGMTCHRDAVIMMMNLRIYLMTWLFLVRMDNCLGQGTGAGFSGFGLAKTESLLEGDVLARCGTIWYKVCSINGQTRVIADKNDIQTLVCPDYYQFLYANFWKNYDVIGQVTQNVFTNVDAYDLFSCKLQSIECQPIEVRCPVLASSNPVIKFGELNETQPVPTQPPDLKEGDIVIMTCYVYGGIPKPTLKWQAPKTLNIDVGGMESYRDETITTNVTVIFYRTVRVNLTREHDQSIYICNVTQEGISNNIKEHLQVKFAPVISILDSETVQKSTFVTIQCTVQSNPISDTKLIKPDGQQITQHDQILYEEDPHNITYSFGIGIVKPSDRGNYTCLARNTVGTVSWERNKTTMLFIEFTPVISVPDSQTVQESDYVTIQCTVYSYPVSEVKLLKPDGQTLEDLELMTNRNDPNNITYSFNIGQVAPSDGGEYKCLAKNKIGGVDQGTVETTMLFIEFAPVISVPDSQTVQESDYVTIQCTVYSYPVSEVNLLKPDGQTLHHQEPIPIGNDPINITYSFNIGQVAPSDGGKYKCLAKNEIGGVDQERNETTMLFIEFAPVISVPDSQTVQVPTSVTIQCTVYSYPVSEVNLLKPDGQTLHHQEFIPNGNDHYNITYSFNIGQVTPSDGGEYKCLAKNKIGGIDQEGYETTMLFIEFAPVISVPDSQTVQESTSVTIQCTVYSYPVSEVNLLEPDGQILHHQEPMPFGNDPNNMTYIFNIGQVAPSDGGKYKCLAKNQIGGVDQERNETTMLFIEFAPVISVPDSQTVQESTSVTIQCTVYSYPVSEVKLLKPDGQILEDLELVTNGDDPINITYSFNIGQVTPSDGGEYKCLAKNQIGGVDQEGYETTMLFIEFTPVISVPDSQTVQESTLVTIQCTVYSYPVAEVKLLKPDGQILEDLELMTNGNDPYNITYYFNIGQVAPSDGGKYKCLAKNTIGGIDQERNETTVLVIEYAPIVTLLDQHRAVEFTDVFLRCHVKSVPPSKITWFDEKNSYLPSQLFEVVSWTGESLMRRLAKLSIPNVRPNNGGEYTCRAENMVGNEIQVRSAITMLYVEATAKTCTAMVGEKKTCRCNKRRSHIKPQQNLTSAVLMEVMEATKKELTRDRTSLSSYTSTKISATDNRPSSISLGFLGIVVIIVAVSFIVSSDVMTVVIKLKMRYFNDQILSMEEGQVEVPKITEECKSTTGDDEKPSTSCDYNIKPVYPCSSNDNNRIKSQSAEFCEANMGKQTEDIGKTLATTSSDKETESKSNETGVILVASTDRDNRNNEVDDAPVLRSNNDDKEETVVEVALGSNKDETTKMLPSAASSPVVKGKTGGAAIGKKVKRVVGKPGVQKKKDKLAPYKLTSYKLKKVKSSSLASKPRTSKVSPSSSGIKAGKTSKNKKSATPGKALKITKENQSTSTSKASKTFKGKESASIAGKVDDVGKPSTSTASNTTDS